MVTLFSGCFECFWYILKDVICYLSTFFLSVPLNFSQKTEHVKNGNFTFFPVRFPFLASSFHGRHYFALMLLSLLFCSMTQKMGGKTNFTTKIEKELFRLVLLWMGNFQLLFQLSNSTNCSLWFWVISYLFFSPPSISHLQRFIDNSEPIYATRKLIERAINFWREKKLNWSVVFNVKIQTVCWVQHPLC